MSSKNGTAEQTLRGVALDDGVVVEPKDAPAGNTISWGELTEVHTKTVALEKYGGKTITYRTMIPLDEMIALQMRYKTGKPGADTLGYFVALINYIIIDPPMTPREAQAARKADAGLIFGLIGEVISPSEATELQKALQDQGEA